MLATIAELLLYIALSLSCVQICTTLITDKVKIFQVLALLQFTLIATSFGLLISCFIVSDFSVTLVANHSHTSKPLVFKVAATWANHEGSMLMWVLVLATLNLLYALFANSSKYHSVTLAAQGFITALFLLYTIFLSNPFVRSFPSPITGLGLNPVLQDIGLVLHPPILYLGYVGFSIAYSSSLAALISGREIRSWALSIMPFVTFSWCILTLGIGLGSWWAYRELGWGGFWFWDPVENASLIPWLSATALIHTLKVTLNTSRLASWALLLSLLTFSLSGVGTFLVRSGAITSVHSFASDPARGIAIIAIVIILVSIGVTTFLINNDKFSDSNIAFHKKILYITLNNIFLIFFTIVVITGTIYPIIFEMISSEAISIGAPYYVALLRPTTIVLLILCLIAPSIGSDYGKIKSFIKYNLIFSLIISFLIHCYLTPLDIVSSLIILLSLNLILDNTFKLFKNIWQHHYHTNQMLLAHLGFAILALSITINSVAHIEASKDIGLNQEISFGNYLIIAKEINHFKGPNYLSQIIKFEAWNGKKFLGFIYPEIHFYPVEKQTTIEAGILHLMWYDIYISVNHNFLGDKLTAKIYFRPMINFMWFGCLLLFASGLLLTLKYFSKLYKSID